MKWADEIAAKPIDVLLVNGGAGNGKVEIKEADVNSAAFRVQAAGGIEWASVLTNSTLLFPVHVALGRPYAAKLGMVNASTPTNAAYLLLPDFLTIKGTLGKVEPEISKTGLLKVAGKAVGGLGKETGLAIGEAGKSIYGATSTFMKDKFGNSNTNAASATDTNTAAEQGGSQTAGKGDGPASNKGGDQAKADQPSGGKSSGEKGAGSQSQPGGDKPGGQEQGKNGNQGDGKSSGEAGAPSSDTTWRSSGKAGRAASRLSR